MEKDELCFDKCLNFCFNEIPMKGLLTFWKAVLGKTECGQLTAKLMQTKCGCVGLQGTEVIGIPGLLSCLLKVF